jgi:predicted CXXCH cytochrome family protein
LILGFALALTVIISLTIMGSVTDDDETRQNGSQANWFMDLATYNGSTECGICHQVAHDAWKDSLHPKKVMVANSGSVVGDWAGGTLQLSNGLDATINMTKNSTGYWVSLAIGGPDYKVDYVLGGAQGGWEQRYLTTVGNSRYVLPIQWNLDDEEWVPYNVEDWYDMGTGEPKSIDVSRSWDRNCAGCHVTGAEVSYNDTSGEWVATWAELGVGCEACHGPGSLHIDPPEGEDRSDFIWSTVDSTICGFCHNRGSSVGELGGMKMGYPVNADGEVYMPGDPMDEFFVSDRNFHPDGETSRNHRQQYPDYLGHPHSESLATILESERGSETCLKCHSTDYMIAPVEEKPALEEVEFNIECVACHDSHGSSHEHDLRVDQDQVCSQCHQTFDTPPGETVHHPQTEMISGTIPIDEIVGIEWMDGRASCTDCHMPLVATSAVDYDIASHRFYFIGPDKSVDLGMPNSCTVTCHDADGPGSVISDELAKQQIEGWRTATTTHLAEAEGYVTTAQAALDAAVGFGFAEDTILVQQELFNDSLLAKDYVASDGTMVHNHEFAGNLLNFSIERATEVSEALAPGKIEGMLRDADDKPVAGAEVRIGDQVWAITGTDGSFQVQIAPGDYKFLVFEGAKKTHTFEATALDGGDTTDLGKVKYVADEDDGLSTLSIAIIIAVGVVALVMALWAQRQRK